MYQKSVTQGLQKVQMGSYFNENKSNFIIKVIIR